jgi:hypothetical protein
VGVVKPLGPDEGINALRHPDCRACDEWERINLGLITENRQLKEKLAQASGPRDERSAGGSPFAASPSAPTPEGTEEGSRRAGPDPLIHSVPLEVAKQHGLCPCCESYGGGDEPEGHGDSECPGVCPECWCPGCHDGHDFPEARIGELDDEQPSGSWLAFELIHGANPAYARFTPVPLPSPEATRAIVDAAIQPDTTEGER